MTSDSKNLSQIPINNSMSDTGLLNDGDDSTNSIKQGTDTTSNKTSFIFTFMNLMRMIIGVGILALPQAVQSSGIIGGPSIILVIGLILMYNMIILSKYNRMLIKKYDMDLGLSETIEYSTRPYIGEKLSICIRHFFNGFIVFYLTCACGAYFLSSKDILNNMFTEPENKYKDYIIYGVLVASLVCSFATSPFIVSIVSMLSNIMCIFGLSSIVVYSLTIVSTPEISIKPVSVWEFFNSVNSVIFTFEVMSSVIPVINTIDKPKRIPALLILSNVVTMILYLFMAIIGYLAYGQKIESLIVLNMPKNIFFNVVRVIFSLGLMLSFAVLTFCVMTIVLPPFLEKVKCAPRMVWEFVLRFIVIAIAITVALTITNFSELLGLIAAFFAVPISFVLPPLVALLTSLQHEMGSKKKRRCLVYFLLLIFGTIINLIGIITTIRSFVLPKSQNGTVV